ncbi:MAG: aminoglycoside phosphotransferase [Methylophilaceae bacterium]|nr:aminoglycoside phosphotransferase [Methylophilaceae bacterium]NDF81189.1 aminoglycoside phosphotransferase [Methylophilaceae bacterium]
MTRELQITEWLNNILKNQEYTIKPASSDASFRRYFRIVSSNQSYILMDAPPEKENSKPFVEIANVLFNAGLNVPKIHKADFKKGFLLLSDLGNKTYLDELNQQNASLLYRDAYLALIKIQKNADTQSLKPYNDSLLMKELSLFPDWYLKLHKSYQMNDSEKNILGLTFDLLIKNINSHTQVFVHRDFHSRNLMFCNGDLGENPGILDFQDAVKGSIVYDLVSLFKDAYIVWKEEEIMDWLIRYWEKAKQNKLKVQDDFAEFYRDFEWMGVQRHLKVLGIFARLNYRDHKANYLSDLPAVENYLRRACERYKDLHPLLKLMNKLSST